jgi:phage terminase large subunit-like protein
MIKRIYQDTVPILKKSEKEVNEFLNELSKDNKEYVVGIDYASIYSKDHTAVAYFTEEENGVFKLEGVKIL